MIYWVSYTYSILSVTLRSLGKGTLYRNFAVLSILAATPGLVGGQTLSFTTAVLAGDLVNNPYSQTLKAQGGSGSYAWSSSGTLPAGLSLNSSTGVLSGTPAVAGVYNLSVTVTDNTAPARTATQGYTLVVGQQYVISTFAGGVPPPTPSFATTASFNAPGGVAVDAAGNVYFTANYSVFRRDTQGVLTRVAGNAHPGYSGDGGPAVNARLDFAGSVTLDASGNIYIPDTWNQRIRKVSPSGIISTVAGTGVQGYKGDGAGAIDAFLSYPTSLAFDSNGNLYVADMGNALIRKITPDGIISTFAGIFSYPSVSAGDGGPAAKAQFICPVGVAADASNNIFILDNCAEKVRKVSAATGIINTIAGNGGQGFSGDGGPAVSAGFNVPMGIAVDTSGDIYIADTIDNRIREIGANGIINTVAGCCFDGSATNIGDGRQAVGAVLGFPHAVAVDSVGNFYIADGTNYRIRQVSQAGIIDTIAGDGSTGFSGDGGPAASAQLSFLVSGIAANASGNLYIADTENFRVRKVSSGIMSTLAGTGTLGFGGDGGPAVMAEVRYVESIATNSSGNVWILDSGNGVVRKVDVNGNITTVAGIPNGAPGFQGDGGPAVNALFNFNQNAGIAVDAAGNLYIADSGNYRIRRVDLTGTITTIAGNGTSGFSGDGGPAVNATLESPQSLAVDGALNVYLTDNNRIRKISAAGIISTLAGYGAAGFSGDDGPALSALLSGPAGLSADFAGNLYFSDQNNRVRMISTAGIIRTVAGSGVTGYSGDAGPAVNASFANVASTAIDGAGNIYAADFSNQAIRVLQPSAAPPLNIGPISFVNGAVQSRYPIYSLKASGGTPAYVWSVTALPPGLSLDAATGVISGTPTTQGTWDLTVTVTDSGTVAATGTPPQVASLNSRIIVTGTSPQITTTSLPDGITGELYPSTTIGVQFGTPPYKFSITSGSLPGGLSLNLSTGTISGTVPTGPLGNNVFTVTVSDSAFPPQTISETFTLTIYQPLTSVTPAALPAATVGSPYNTRLLFEGGNGNAIWSAAGVPAWLTFPPDGFLSGTPPTAGLVNLTVSLTDGEQTVGATQIALPVIAPTGQGWAEVAPPESGPPDRYAHTAVLDSNAAQMIVFGGTAPTPINSPTVLFNDVWSLNTLTSRWSKLAPAGTPPEARFEMTSVYDSATSRMIVFGGQNISIPCSNDVWVLANANGAGGTPAWTQLSPAGTGPSARSGHSATYDPGSNRMIVFGGSDCSSTLNNEVWILTNANGLGGAPTWIQLNPSGTLPSQRSLAGAVYDEAANQLIVFSGYKAAADVWVLSNANALSGTPTWSQAMPAAGPSPRYAHTAVLDSASNRMVVYGGIVGIIDTPEAWVLSNANGSGGTPLWQQVAALGAVPSARSFHTAVYDTASNRMIISYGRSVYDTWALGDANGVTSIGSISPNMAIPGGPGFTLTVNGEGFVAGAAVRWNGTPLVTTFVSANQLTAAVPASLTARQGTARIVAMNPGDAPSGPVPFTIRAPLGPVRR